MEKLVTNFFKVNNLKLNNKTIVVAVSTGVDSMVLLNIFNNIKNEYKLKIHIAHVNHQVRQESKIEEEFLKDYAKANNLEFHLKRLTAPEDKNFQSFAREERYSFFNEVIDEVKADYLLLAHHANDNMETIIMRLLRGSNLRGYAGIKGVTSYENYSLVRPLIEVDKEDLLEYAKEQNLTYFEDSSNIEDIYTRNRIRKDIIPVIISEEKDASSKFLELSKTLFEASDIISSKVVNIINTYNKKEDEISFQKEEFLKLSEFFQIEVLFEILKKYKLSKANIIEIINLIKSSKANLKVEFKESFTLVKEYDKITLLFYLDKPFDFEMIIDKVGTYTINDTIAVFVLKSDVNNKEKASSLWYNSSMLPVKIRSRKAGDKILLESGFKKVKDLLIDLKVGVLKRDKVIILEKDEDILAILGIRKSIKLKEIKDNDIIIEIKELENG